MKPFLASNVDLKKLVFPVLVSAKMDGVRALIVKGRVLGRSLKPIPNEYVQATLGGRPELEGYDGELIVGDPRATDVCRVTTSGVMSKDGTPNVRLYAFDRHDLDAPFQDRLLSLRHAKHVEIVPHVRVSSVEEVEALERSALAEGFEGLILRDPGGRYKHGRSTTKEGGYLRLKRHEDAEAEVIGFEERMHNLNAAKKNELGHTERSSHAENLVPAGDLGALVCRTPAGVEFRIGTGFDQATRESLWAERELLPGRTVKYKFFPVGIKEAPRHPVFISFRDPIDLG